MGKAPGHRLAEEQRQEIIATAHEVVNVTHLAQRYKCARETIVHWRNVGLQHNPNVADAAGRGRKPSLTQPIKDLVRKKANKGLKAARIAFDLLHAHNPGASATTVRRVLTSGRCHLNYLPLRAKRKLSQANATHHLAFVKGHLHSHFKTWVFTDA